MFSALLLVSALAYAAPEVLLFRIGGTAAQDAQEAAAPLVVKQVEAACAEPAKAFTASVAVEFTLLANGKSGELKPPGGPATKTAYAKCLIRSVADLSISNANREGTIRFRLEAGPTRNGPAWRREAVVPKSEVRIGTPESDGGIDMSAVVRALSAWRSGFRACHEKRLKENPSIMGKVTLGFALTREGHAERLDVEGDTTGDPALAECLVDRLTRIRFPKAERETRVSVPFVFFSEK